jgi:hypothetical protein
MRLLVALSILAVLQTTPTVSRKAPQESNPGTEKIQNNTDSDKRKAAPAPAQNTERHTTESKDGHQVVSGDEQKHVIVERFPDKDIWDKSYILLTGVLVLIGALTLGAIWYQAVQTKNATKAMERSTGITVEIERGRIVTYWDQMIHMDLSPTGVHDGRLEHCFNWSCANAGKTPAQLTGIWSRFIAVDKLSDLPEKPVYDIAKERVYEGEPLEPHSKERQTVWFSTPLETDLSFDDMQEKSRSRQCFLYAYGYARYRDVWANPHVTRFGVVRFITESIMEDHWIVGGPSEYNRSE